MPNEAPLIKKNKAPSILIKVQITKDHVEKAKGKLFNIPQL